MQMTNDGGSDAPAGVTSATWSAIKAWATDSGISAKTAQKWKERGSIPRSRAFSLLEDNAYRRYGLRKADVLALAGRQT